MKKLLYKLLFLATGVTFFIDTALVMVRISNKHPIIVKCFCDIITAFRNISNIVALRWQQYLDSNADRVYNMLHVATQSRMPRNKLPLETLQQTALYYLCRGTERRLLLEARSD